MQGLARSSGQDLMRGEHVVGAAAKRDGVNGGWSAHPRYYEQKIAAEKRLGREISTAEFERDYFAAPDSEIQSGTSIFDPVLCELVYRWFCPSAGAVLDPFAGGSVRGIVAAKLERAYTGVDLRPEQIAANEDQAKAITPGNAPRWIAGDSREISALAPGLYDLIFSCPPYADLEVYSDDPRDLSTLDYADFLQSYRAIIAASVDMLSPDRFACFVVGDVRDRKGFYRNFVSDTIAAFQDAGARLYNEAILVTSVGSLPIRVGRQFEAGRKLGKTHQNVLVFVKGDPRRATEACGQIDVFDPAEEFGEVVE
jgi:DNA modification methylase